MGLKEKKIITKKNEQSTSEKNRKDNISKKNNIKSQKRILKTSVKFKSIKSELLITMTLILALLTVGIVTSASFILSSSYNKDIESKNEMLSTLISKNLSSFMDGAYRVIEDLTFNSDIISMEGSVQESVLKGVAERNKYFDSIYVQDMTGMQIAKTSGTLLDESSSWWFKQVRDSLRATVSKGFFSQTSQKLVTSIFMPIYNNGKMVGIIGADIQLTSLQELIQQFSNEKDGRYSFVLDSDGNVIAHPNIEAISQMYNYKTLTKSVQVTDKDGKALRTENGALKITEEPIEIPQGYKKIVSEVMLGYDGSNKFDDNGSGYYASYTPLRLSGQTLTWSVITVQKEAIAKSIIKKVIISTLIASLIILIVALVFIFLVSKKIANPICEISNLLNRASNGDFTLSFENNSKNEIGLLASSFNEMINKVSNLLNRTRNLTQNITDSSVILNDKSEQSTRVAKEVNVAVKEIAAGASTQADESEESVNLGLKMNEKFNKLNEKTKLMIKEANISSNATEEGLNKVNILKEKTEMTISIIEKTEDSINNLQNKSKDIEKILEALNNIASQTKLLSLNASIEAARAGEYGKSFGVVANEIQKLSNESDESTKNIAGIIHDIQNEILTSVDMMKNVRNVSEEQFMSVNQVNEAFSKITGTIKGISRIIEDIGTFVKEMDQSNNKVVRSINNIASISQETATCSEEVTASLQEQTEGIAEVAKQSEELKEKARLLEIEINKFKI